MTNHRSVAGRVRWTLLGFAMLAAVAAGCGKQNDETAVTQPGPGTATSEPKAAPTVVDQTFDLPIAVEISGDYTVKYAKTTKFRILTRTGGASEYAHLQLFSAGSEGPEQLEDGRQFRVAFDLKNYAGEKKYKMEPWDYSTAAAVGESGNTIVHLWEPGAPAASPSAMFVKGPKGCSIDIGPEGRAGTLYCEDVRDLKGKKVSVRMAWGGRSLPEA